MNTSFKSLKLTALATVFAAAGFAQTPTPPYILFQNASLTGVGNTIMANRVPVVTAAGVTIYANLAMQFDVDANGNVSISTGFPQAAPSPALITSTFKAGKYVGLSTTGTNVPVINVSGPGVTDGGATLWSFAPGVSTASCTYPYTGMWYVGPISSSPLAARLKTAGITSTAYSYGTLGSGPTCFPGSAWYGNALIGVSQIGNTITFVSFTNGSSDHNTSQDQITFTLSQ